MHNKKSVFTRKGSGTKKIAPINMRKEEHQFVIDGYLVDEVLKQVPAGLKIIQAYVYAVDHKSTAKIAIPNSLKKLGVSSIYTAGSSKRVTLTFDQTSKENIKNKLDQVCKLLNLDRNRAYFRYVVLSNGEGTVKFEHCTKEIKPDETDLRKKLRVLGATLGTGKVQSVISNLNASKYVCHIKEQPVRFIMCSKG